MRSVAVCMIPHALVRITAHQPTQPANISVFYLGFYSASFDSTAACRIMSASTDVTCPHFNLRKPLQFEMDLLQQSLVFLCKFMYLCGCSCELFECALRVICLFKLVFEHLPFKPVLCEQCSYHGWYGWCAQYPANSRWVCVPVLVVENVCFEL